MTSHMSTSGAVTVFLSLRRMLASASPSKTNRARRKAVIIRNLSVFSFSRPLTRQQSTSPPQKSPAEKERNRESGARARARNLSINQEKVSTATDVDSFGRAVGSSSARAFLKGRSMRFCPATREKCGRAHPAHKKTRRR